jgi:hypothetical protein
MRLIGKHSHRHPLKAPRISISQAEITADLHYPAPRPVTGAIAPGRLRGARR